MLARNEIIRLLQVATTYDGRDRDQADVMAWQEVSRRGRWTFDEALEAIHAHFAVATDPWLMPGHITQRIKDQRRCQPSTRAIAVRSSANPVHIRAVVVDLGKRLGWHRTEPREDS